MGRSEQGTGRDSPTSSRLFLTTNYVGRVRWFVFTAESGGGGDHVLPDCFVRHVQQGRYFASRSFDFFFFSYHPSRTLY